MGSEGDDAILVEAARHGDRDAFGRLLARHWPLLLSLCRRMLEDAESAHDVAQEAALRAFLSLDRLRRAEQFGPWLCGIGLNIGRHQLRQREHTNLSWDALAGGRAHPAVDIPDASPGPQERAETADLRARVQRAIAGLPRGQRAAIVLYYLHGLSQAETAAHLGIEIGAVKTRLHKGRGALRLRLSELWEGNVMTTPVEAPMISMRIESVHKAVESPAAAPPELFKKMKNPAAPASVIVLQEVEGPRFLCIWVGDFEAALLTAALEHAETPRPMTYAFMANLLEAAQVTLREVQINKLADTVFYAATVIDGATGVRTVDARPSDALNLAALIGAPIRVAPAVLDAAAITVEQDTIRDADGREVIEQTVRSAAAGEELDRAHLDPVTRERIRVLFHRDWSGDEGKPAATT